MALQYGSLLASEETLSELAEVLLCPRFDRHVDLDTRGEFLSKLLQQVELVEITESVVTSRDPTDDKFLELALSGRATHIITGDQDLLDLHPFRGVSIVTPRGFLNEFGSSG